MSEPSTSSPSSSSSSEQQQEAQGGILQTLVDNDELRASAYNITRIQNVDVIPRDFGLGGSYSRPQKDPGVALCHIAILSPLSRVRNGAREIEFADELENIAAALLAMEHFNAGNGSIIPDIDGIHQRCNIRFTTELVDTEHSESAAVEQVIEIVSRNYADNINEYDNHKPLPCAFVGSTRSSVCIPTAIITGIKGYPQFSPECTSPQLNNADQFPLFGRLINSDDGTSLPVLQWLQQRAHVRHLAVLYRTDTYGIGYARAVQNTAKMLDVSVEMVSIPYHDVVEADFDRVVQQLKDTQYQYIFGIISRSLHYDTLMTKAFEAAIAGDGRHSWIFSDSLGTRLLSRSFPPGSPLHLATQGIGVISPTGGNAGDPKYDRYARALRELDNPYDLNYIRSKLPRFADVDEEEYQEILDKLKLTNVPAETFSPLGYDTIIALGQAACRASSFIPGSYFDGPGHFEATVNYPFDGISGHVVLDPESGSRDPESALFNMLNFVEDEDSVPTPEDIEEGTTISFKGVVTESFHQGVWVEMEPYIYNGGSSVPPLDLPEQELNYNFIGRPLRAVGLSMSVIIICLSIGFGVWTRAKRKTRVVRASQPIFLLLICVGTLLMGASIIPLSIDDEIASLKGCNIACMSTWWLLGIGFPIAFSALFTKTYRINRLIAVGTRFQRVAIGAGDVMWPMVVFIGANALILTLFTILSPLKWQRKTISEDPFGRPNESYGYCGSDSALPFIVLLVCCNLGGLVVGVVQAYKARHLSTDFAESEYIAMAMVLLLVVGFIAIPVAIIAEDNPGAFFFVITALVFVCALSLLLLIFLPKVRSVSVGPTNVPGSSRSRSKRELRLSVGDRRPSALALEGIACVDTEKILPRIERENKALRNLTSALKSRVQFLETEAQESALFRSSDRSTALTDQSSRFESTREGMKVHDKHQELQDSQEENRRLRNLRKELEGRLTDLEKKQRPYESVLDAT